MKTIKFLSSFCIQSVIMKRILNLVVSVLLMSYAYGQDIPLANFEQSTYQWLPTGELWTTTGTCFGTGPVQGTLVNQQTVTGYLGKGLVNTYLGGDNSMGTLTSPTFRITRKYIRFLIGGGNWRPQTSINLVVNGEVVRAAVGMGDIETLGWLQWDVSAFFNKTARIQIVDSTANSWGHLHVDQIIATDVSLLSVINVDKNYLLLPVKTGVTKQLVELVQEGLVVREMKVELSSTPDFWVFMDLTPFKGQELVVRLNSKLANSTELQNFFVQKDSITTGTPVYKETIRPIYHYTPKRGFMSDPNNLVYKDGEYHMSYQHNPYGCAWDNMHHGHAVSTDLVHWKELPEAIYPTYWGTAWNGSSVVDWKNTAGFGLESIVTLYTSVGGWSDNSRMSLPNRFAQSLAYSTDNGRTFEYYEGNPVIPNFYNSEHDPVVFWYEPGKVWVMTLFVGDSGGYHIFNSTNLKNWVFTSSVNIPGTTEVSDLFPLALDGDTTNVKWVFSAGYRQYIVGTFDGKKFTQEYGPFRFASQEWDLSAALTFNNIPDGRRIMLSNGRTDYPGMPFNRYMNLPNVLTLKTNSAGEPRVYVNPVEEVSKLRTNTLTWNSRKLNTGVNLMNGLYGEGVEMEIVFKPQPTSVIKFRIGEFSIIYDAKLKRLGAGGDTNGWEYRSLSPIDGKVHIRAFYDRGSWELFANGGEFYMPFVITPKSGNWPLSLTTAYASIEIDSLSLHHLGSIWDSKILDPLPTNPNDLSKSFPIYPNPCNNKFYFSNDNLAASLDLFDLNGRLILNQKLGSGKNEINVSSIKQGFYLVRVMSDKSVNSFKIIKQ